MRRLAVAETELANGKHKTGRGNQGTLSAPGAVERLCVGCEDSKAWEGLDCM
jgi:hypothetical protein